MVAEVNTPRGIPTLFLLTRFESSTNQQKERSFVHFVPTGFQSKPTTANPEHSGGGARVGQVGSARLGDDVEHPSVGLEGAAVEGHLALAHEHPALPAHARAEHHKLRRGPRQARLQPRRVLRAAGTLLAHHVRGVGGLELRHELLKPHLPPGVVGPQPLRDEVGHEVVALHAHAEGSHLRAANAESGEVLGCARMVGARTPKRTHVLRLTWPPGSRVNRVIR